MKLCKENQKLQDLWIDILSAARHCPQHPSYPEICPYDSILDVYTHLVDGSYVYGLNDLLFNKGYWIHLSHNTKDTLRKIWRARKECIATVLVRLQDV